MGSERSVQRARGMLLPRRRLVWARGLVWALATGLGFSLSSAGEAVSFSEYRPESARDYLQAVVDRVESELRPGAEGKFVLARIRGQLGETQEAERLARLALEHDPNRAEIQSFLAGLFIHEDRMEEAAACLRQALRLHPDQAGDWRRLAMVLDRLGDRQGARDALETAVRVAPEDSTARFVLGRLLLDLGETREAAGHLRRACQLDPAQAGAFYALFEAFSLLGEAEGARDSLERFQELKQKERDFYDRKHLTYDDDGYMRGLVSGFHTEVAGVFVRQGQPVPAEAHLRQALRIAPALVAAQEMLAALLLQSGRRAEARDVCASLVRLDPNRASYRANLGTLLLQLNEPTAAVEELKRALALDPGQGEALNNLARFYLGTRRDLTEALALSRRLVELRPVASSYDLLGWALYVNGQLQEARAAAAQAVQLDPDNPVYRERLQRLGGER